MRIYIFSNPLEVVTSQFVVSLEKSRAVFHDCAFPGNDPSGASQFIFVTFIE